jgi:hypothetical protein
MLETTTMAKRQSRWIGRAIAATFALGAPWSSCRSDAPEDAPASKHESPPSPKPDTPEQDRSEPEQDATDSSTPAHVLSVLGVSDFGRLELPANGRAFLPLMSRIGPITQASLGSDQPATFLLDTGSTAAAFRPDLARIWDLKPAEIGGLDVQFADGMTSVNNATVIPSLHLHEAHLNDTVALLCERREFEFFDGVLGIATISQAPLLIDGSKFEAGFIASEKLRDSLERLYPGRHWSAIELNSDGTQAWVVLTAREHSIKLRLDTGAICTKLFMYAVKALNLTAIANRPNNVVDDSGEQSGTDVFELTGLELGKWKVRVEFQPIPDREATQPEDDLNGVLGYDVLGRIPIVVDFSRRALWICDPVKQESDNLRVSDIDRLRIASRDPMPSIRLLAAFSIFDDIGSRRIAVAGELLDDDVAEVRETAAHSVMKFAKETWSDKSLVDDARKWWAAHKNDEEFQ